MLRLFTFSMSLLVLTACGRVERGPAWPEGQTGMPRVLSTTTIIGDIVAQVAGEDAHLITLLPAGADPHDYQFRPRDMALAADADVVFLNGGGLEGNLESLLRATRGDTLVVALEGVLDDVEPLRPEHAAHHHGHSDDTCDHGEGDPHYWTDPHHVMQWTTAIAEALASLAPDYADGYRSRAAAYLAELETLDAWIRSEMDQIPPERRFIITDHLMLGHFALRYGLEERASILKSVSTAAQPSASELASVVRTLASVDMRVLFVADNVSPSVAGRIARDTGATVVLIPSGSLTESDGYAPDYLSYMRFIVNQLVEHLAQPEGDGA